jgi:hypothetical protein
LARFLCEVQDRRNVPDHKIPLHGASHADAAGLQLCLIAELYCVTSRHAGALCDDDSLISGSYATVSAAAL